MQNVNRRSFVRSAALAAAATAALAMPAFADEDLDECRAARGELPTPQNSSNFNVVEGSTTVVGTTLENLKSAVAGETGATTKYTAFAEYAEEAGYTRLARLFRCTADAEKIHIELEAALVEAEDPSYERPTAEPPAPIASDLALIAGANGEIYETSDMYPAFIQVAIAEGCDDAVEVFTRAKLAEAYHAERYLDAYNNIDERDEDAEEGYYLCPVCGYIHKGEPDHDDVCPICAAPSRSWKRY